MTRGIVAAMDLISRWKSRRDELHRLRASVDGAAMCDDFLADLEAILREEPIVNLSAAAAECGYTAGHLSKLVRSGRLRNYGRPNSPRVRVSECPRKALRVAEGRGSLYDPVTDARSLVSARR